MEHYFQESCCFELHLEPFMTLKPEGASERFQIKFLSDVFVIDVWMQRTSG